jgi:hypothetical protein
MTALTAAGFTGMIHPVNLHGAPVHGLPSRRSARDLPAGVDLAIVAVPAGAVLDVVDDCAAAGVKALVVVTAGFAEVGADGRALQKQLVDKVRGCRMRMVGPNCLGCSTRIGRHAQRRSLRCFRRPDISPCRPEVGRWALRSSAWPPRVGLSQFVSVGNKADVSGAICSSIGRRRPDPRPAAVSRIVRSRDALRDWHAVSAGRNRSWWSRPDGLVPDRARQPTRPRSPNDTAVEACFTSPA